MKNYKYSEVRPHIEKMLAAFPTYTDPSLAVEKIPHNHIRIDFGGLVHVCDSAEPKSFNVFAYDNTGRNYFGLSLESAANTVTTHLDAKLKPNDDLSLDPWLEGIANEPWRKALENAYPLVKYSKIRPLVGDLVTSVANFSDFTKNGCGINFGDKVHVLHTVGTLGVHDVPNRAKSQIGVSTEQAVKFTLAFLDKYFKADDDIELSPWKRDGVMDEPWREILTLGGFRKALEPKKVYSSKLFFESVLKDFKGDYAKTLRFFQRSSFDETELDGKTREELITAGVPAKGWKDEMFTTATTPLESVVAAALDKVFSSEWGALVAINNEDDHPVVHFVYKGNGIVDVHDVLNRKDNTFDVSREAATKAAVRLLEAAGVKNAVWEVRL